MGVFAEPVELAAAERADGHDEGRVANLVFECNDRRIVEFFGTVHREAVRWPAQQPRHHRHLSPVGSEMRVDVVHFQLPKPALQCAGFEQVCQMAQPTTFRTVALAERQPEQVVLSLPTVRGD